MIHFSLFSGIGGFDLAAEWMGWKNYVSCEINEFANKILEHHFPDAYHHRDITTLTYDTITDLLTSVVSMTVWLIIWVMPSPASCGPIKINSVPLKT